MNWIIVENNGVKILYNSYCKPTIKLSENYAVISYGMKTVTIFEKGIFFVGSAESWNPFCK